MTALWIVCVLFVASQKNAVGFAPVAAFQRSSRSAAALHGYLDDLQNMSPQDDAAREKTKLDKDRVENYGVGDWESYVEFDEFDGGDGQMGVAGDGKKGLDKEWVGQAELLKSKTMSAKNAWGRSTGYADRLISQGMEATRAQQMENWMNQQELQQARNQAKWMTEEFDKVSADEDWRKLKTFGVERTQDFDLDAAFGAVVPGDKIEGIVELTARLNQAQVYEFYLKNPFMGFSDFRAAFTPETSREWTIEPTEGSLNGRGAPTQFVLKFRAQNPGTSEGYLVIETEDDKWTWKLVGTGSM